MREIMFRGMRKDGVWVYGYYQKSCDNGGYYSWINDEVGDIHDIDPVTVGQYTGLKDKNGKEIYEGDIVEFWGGIGFVEYREPNCAFVINYAEGSYFEFYVRIQIKSVGNIYENPELLEEVQ